MNTQVPLLQLNNVQKSFSTPGGQSVQTVLKDISFTLNAGDSLSIAGPSGSGKSTLLNIIGALDKPDSGEVKLNGENLASKTEEQLSIIRAEKIGFIFQLHHLLPQLTVLENVLLPALAAGKNTAEKAEYAISLLDKIGMQSNLDKRPGQLSGGECQRTAFARALINQPDLILADEPTGSLDQARADELAEILIHLNNAQNTALIIVTHSAELAHKLSMRAELHNGILKW